MPALIYLIIICVSSVCIVRQRIERAGTGTCPYDRDKNPKRVIRLFEGFISNKKGRDKSSHIEDVERLSAAISKENIAEMPDIKNLESAFKVAGMDFGVPLVIKPPID